MCAHNAHYGVILKAAPHSNSTTKGYARGKKRTNLSLDRELVRIATQHFARTRHGSLSGFVENALRREFRAAAASLRQAGVALPESLFIKQSAPKG